MVCLASLALAAAGLSTALASKPGSSPSWLLKRTDLVTGCTCCGYDVSFGSDMDNMATSFILNWAYGQGSANTGFCFQDGELEPSFVAMIRTAVETGEDSAYVNATGAKIECDLMGWNTVDACVQGIVDGYEAFIVGPDGTTTSEWIHAGCAYPPENFVPTDCYCGWKCAAGFVQCGDRCMTECPSDGVAAAPSGIPNAQNIPARQLPESVPMCAAGEELCPLPSAKGFECLDTSSNLEACGACPFQPGSDDCTAIPGVQAVQCVAGKCQVESCVPGYILRDNHCQLA